MVVLAASICTRSGKPLLSRQFRPIPRSRIESLLASFPKLIPANAQHTTIETPDVRFVYQPFEELYVLLITNKASNILQDISTLQLVVRLIASLTPAMTEGAILHHSFDLLCAFDEVVSLGYKENVSLSQVRSVLEGESHEEKIQEIIARNKEAEAKEELKRRAKQLELQRREQQRLAQGGGGGSRLAGGFGSGAYAPVSTQPDFAAPQREAYRAPSPEPPKPAFKGSGMKLGSKKGRQNDLVNQLGAEVDDSPAHYDEPAPAPSAAYQQPPAAAAAPAATASTASYTTVPASILPKATPGDIHVTIKEALAVSLLRDGGIESFEIKGDLDILVASPATSKAKLVLAPNEHADLQFKQNPNVAKFAPAGDKVIQLKNENRPFPVGRALGVLRWRLTTKDESLVPLTVTVWPQPRGDGSSDVAIEYELEASHLTLENVVIAVPIPPNAQPEVTGDGNYTIEPDAFVWNIGTVDADNSSGSLEIHCDGGADAFFPVNVGFAASASLANLDVASALLPDGSSAPFTEDKILTVAKYEIV